MNNSNWEEFVQVTKNRKPVWLLIKTIKKIKSLNNTALDLGCGAGVDSKYLAKNGFKVDAVDLDQNCITSTKKMCKNLDVKIIKKNIKNYKIKPSTYQLIYSWNTLPFLNKKEMVKVLHGIQKGLTKEGFFVFSLFGIEDNWAKNKPEMAFLTVNELKKILSKMKFIEILETKENKPSAIGKPKFWHQIQGIAQLK